MNSYKVNPIPVTVGSKHYSLLSNYQNQAQYRAAFNRLTEKVFDLTFESWYQDGYWKEKYIPYTLFDGEQAVANLSINIIDFNGFGQMYKCLQLGTIATDEQYRGQGLSRFLMEYVLQEWNSQCDFIYLFANQSVLEFYPKFGFEKQKEYVYFKPVTVQHEPLSFEKINMDLTASREKLYDYINHATPCSSFSMQKNPDLVMFYCTSIMKSNVYYSKTLDVFVIAAENHNQLHVFDVVSLNDIDLETVIQALGTPKINNILLGFTPKNTQGYEIKEKQDEDVLFVQKGKTDLFEKNKIMFPLLSHA